MRAARAIRKKAGLGLEGVGRATSIGPGHLGKFERDEAELSAGRLVELAAFYSKELRRTVTIDEMLAAESDDAKVPAA